MIPKDKPRKYTPRSASDARDNSVPSRKPRIRLRVPQGYRPQYRYTPRGPDQIRHNYV